MDLVASYGYAVELPCANGGLVGRLLPDSRRKAEEREGGRDRENQRGQDKRFRHGCAGTDCLHMGFSGTKLFDRVPRGVESAIESVSHRVPVLRKALDRARDIS
jgi:hypothetical protein